MSHTPAPQETRADKGRSAFHVFSQACPHRLVPELIRRPANALNIEIGSPSDRCYLKCPSHINAFRWLGSGGSPLIFDVCSRDCALGHEWCPECGHRKETHTVLGPGHSCIANDQGFPCACEHYAVIAKATGGDL